MRDFFDIVTSQSREGILYDRSVKAQKEVKVGAGSSYPKEWIDKYPKADSEAMTAIGMIVRISTGDDPKKSEDLKVGADLLAKLMPKWNESTGEINLYYWYWGSQAMHLIGGPSWMFWKSSLELALLGRQNTASGSWPAVDAWSSVGGEVYATAMAVLCLSTEWRVGCLKITSSSAGAAGGSVRPRGGGGRDRDGSQEVEAAAARRQAG